MPPPACAFRGGGARPELEQLLECIVTPRCRHRAHQSFQDSDWHDQTSSDSEEGKLASACSLVDQGKGQPECVSDLSSVECQFLHPLRYSRLRTALTGLLCYVYA